MSIPTSYALKRIVPLSFFVGAGIETFMYFTGFYDIVTHKEAERREEVLKEQLKAQERLKRLNIKFDKD